MTHFIVFFRSLALILGVQSISNHTFYKWLPEGTYNTNISVNSGARGRTILVIGSGQWSNGDNTCSFIWLIRCGFDGNNITKEIIKEMNMPNGFSLNVGVTEDGNLKFVSSHGIYSVLLIWNNNL